MISDHRWVGWLSAASVKGGEFGREGLNEGVLSTQPVALEARRLAGILYALHRHGSVFDPRRSPRTGAADNGDENAPWKTLKLDSAGRPIVRI